MELSDNKSIWEILKKWHIPTDNLEEISLFLDNYSYLSFDLVPSFIINREDTLSGFKLNTFILSAKMTLDSIILCTGMLRLSDAFELVRKYRDSVCFFTYAILTYKIANNDMNTDIINWYKNKMHNYNGEEFKSLFEKIELKEFERKYDIIGKYSNYNKLLNNYVHSNGIKYMNINQYCSYEGYSFSKEKIDSDVNNIYAITAFFTLLFVSMIAIVYPSSIRSTDYIDCIDLGISPNEDSLYWCAPFLSDFFAKHGRILGDDLIKYLYKKTEMRK